MTTARTDTKAAPARDAVGIGCDALVCPSVDMWLDDLRDPNKHGRIGWTWVKTADEAIALLSSGTVRKASLDHDLTVEQTLGREDQEKTGYTVVCWMEEHCVWPKGGTFVHSQNPVGRQKMETVIRRAYLGYRK